MALRLEAGEATVSGWSSIRKLHHFNSAVVNGKTVPIDQAYVTVRLEPGSGSQLEFKMTRYAHQPTLAQPWDRGWMVKR